MASAPFSAIYRYVRGISATAPDAEPTDRQLLSRFARGRDEAAFAALVRRHGPLVMGVCRRVLGNAADAEDAFQATFLVLARRAGLVAWRSSVANWLHVTAYRLAQRLRLAESRRRARERAVAPPAEPAAPAAAEWQELCQLLDGELRRLPASERAALLTCYFEGRTQDEAARELGWSLRTLQRRLERGRNLLRTRLTRKGLPLPVAFLAGALLNEAAAAGSAAETARAAVLFASGGTPTVRAAVTTLAVSTLKANARGLLRITVAGLLVLGLCAAGARLDFLSSEEEEEPLAAVAASDPAVVQPLVDAAGDPLPEGAVSRLGSLRLRHRDAITCTVFSRDGRTLIAGDRSGRVILWDVASGWRLREIVALAQARVTSVAVSAGGKILVSAGSRGRIYVIDPGGDRAAVEWPVERLPEPRPFSLGGGRTQMVDAWGIREFTISPDGKTLAAVFLLTEPTLGVYDVATGKKRLFLKLSDEIARCALTVDGNTLAVSFRKDPAVRLWDVRSGKEVVAMKGHKNGEAELAFSPDGTTLATAEPISAMDQKTLRFWDVATGTERWSETSRGRCASLVYHPDGSRLVATESSQFGSACRLTFRDVKSGAVLFTGGADAWCTGVTLSPDGRSAATTDGTRILALWDTVSAKRHAYPGHTAVINSLSFSGDGTRLVSADGNNRVRIWDPQTGREVMKAALSGPGYNYSEVTFSPDGKFFAGFDPAFHAVYLWDSDGKEVGRLVGNSSGAARYISFGAGGKLLAEVIWNGQSARLWDVAKREEFAELPLKQDHPATAVFSPGGSTLAAGGYDGGGVRRWNVRTGRELSRLETPHLVVYALAIAPGGKVMATAGGERAVYLWDVQTRKQLHRLEAFGELWDWPHLAFTNDGRLLLGARGGWARVWDVATGKEVEKFEHHVGPITAAALSPDGRFAATAGPDATILVWDLTGGKPRARELSADELERCWGTLADADDRTAYRAAGLLAAVPRQSVPFLAERLRPVPALDDRSRERLARLVADLDSDSFDVREKASADLRATGPSAEPLVRKALEGKLSAEVGRRLEGVCKGFGQDTPDWRRARRAMRALERVNSPEALQVLQSLAGGATGARPTVEAEAILERMSPPP